MQLQRDSKDVLPANTRMHIGRKGTRTADVALRCPGGEGGNGPVDAVSLDEEVGDIAR